MIVIKAMLQAKSGMESSLEELLKGIIPSVQTEKDTIVYTLHRSQEHTGRFLFYEKYKDQQACNDHMTTPYLQELLRQCKALLSEPPEIELFEEIAGFTRTINS